MRAVHRRVAALAARARLEAERALEHAAREFLVRHRERGEHDLAGRVVEVGVRDEGAELEDVARAGMGFFDAVILEGVFVFSNCLLERWGKGGWGHTSSGK